jgi:hypothetical protein
LSSHEETKKLVATCPAGTIVTGGGFDIKEEGVKSGIGSIKESIPVPGGWSAIMENANTVASTFSGTFVAYAVCASK